MYASSKQHINFTTSGKTDDRREMPEDMKTAPLKVIKTLFAVAHVLVPVWAYFLFPLPVQQTWDPQTLAEGLSTSWRSEHI